MPALGFGTWNIGEGDEIKQSLQQAIKNGYRHIDCASIYGNQAEIGEALQALFRDGVVTREELWISSKLWNNAHHQVFPALEETLNMLQLDYLDLYLIHWPIFSGVDLNPMDQDALLALNRYPIATTWSDFEKAQETGLVKHIGVSNFTIAHLQALKERATIMPEMNQVEMHPYLQQPALVHYCRAEKIHLTAYAPFGMLGRNPEMLASDAPNLFDDSELMAIATEKGVTTAQILLAWHLNRGIATIPRSTDEGRMLENFASNTIELSESDMARIATLDREYRYNSSAIFNQ